MLINPLPQIKKHSAHSCIKKNIKSLTFDSAEPMAHILNIVAVDFFFIFKFLQYSGLAEAVSLNHGLKGFHYWLAREG